MTHLHCTDSINEEMRKIKKICRSGGVQTFPVSGISFVENGIFQKGIWHFQCVPPTFKTLS